MRRVAVRQLRQNWPEVEAALAREGELIVTRDGQPVARVCPYTDALARPRFSLAKQRQWMARTWGRRFVDWTGEALARDRADRS